MTSKRIIMNCSWAEGGYDPLLNSTRGQKKSHFWIAHFVLTKDYMALQSTASGRICNASQQTGVVKGGALTIKGEPWTSLV